MLEIGEDLNLASDEARLEVPVPGGGAMTLEGARNKAVFALESHESYCPHILGELWTSRLVPVSASSTRAVGIYVHDARTMLI